MTTLEDRHNDIITLAKGAWSEDLLFQIHMSSKFIYVMSRKRVQSARGVNTILKNEKKKHTNENTLKELIIGQK